MTPIHRKQVGGCHGDATIRKSFQEKNITFRQASEGHQIQLSGCNPEMTGLLVFLNIAYHQVLGVFPLHTCP